MTVQACGFELIFQEVEGKADHTKGCPVLPEHAQLALLQLSHIAVHHPCRHAALSWPFRRLKTRPGSLRASLFFRSMLTWPCCKLPCNCSGIP